MPQSWADAMQASSTSPPGGIDFGLTAGGVAGDAVFGQYVSQSESGIGTLDIKTGSLSELSPFGPNAGGLAWISVELPWVVWEQRDSNLQPGWSLVAFNTTTRERVILGSDQPSSGHVVAYGQAPYPVIRKGVVAWSEPIPAGADGKPESRVIAFNLGSRSSNTLDSGIVSSPVFAGSYLIWGKQAMDGTYMFGAVGADDLQPVDVATVLPSPSSSIQYLAGTNEYFAWSSTDLSDLEVLRFSTKTVVDYAATPDLLHRVQFPVLVGDYALWYTGDRFSIMDVTSGRAFDVSGSAAGGNGMIAVAQLNGPVLKGQVAHSRISEVSVSQVPNMTSTGCS